MEQWKDIPNYGGLYQVSSTGKIRNRKLKEIKQKIVKGSPYKRIQLYINGVAKQHYVHRLVLATFNPCPGNDLTVDHIDNNPTNNNLSNLRWMTMELNNKRPKSRKPRKTIKFISNELIEVYDPTNSSTRYFRYIAS